MGCCRSERIGTALTELGGMAAAPNGSDMDWNVAGSPG
jgi:hypothetical protein